MGQEITNYDEAYAKEAARYAKQEALTGGQFLSTRGGVLSFGDETLPGNQLVAVILDAVFENTYYPDKFDSDNPVPPTCYAFGRNDGDVMAPYIGMADHLDYFIPQADNCRVCPKNEFGSADVGRGKACKNIRRLSLIPAGQYGFTPEALKRKAREPDDLVLFDDPAHYQTAPIYMLKLPVLSCKNWSAYVQQIVGATNRPPYGVVTRLFLEPDAKAQYVARFEMIEELKNDLAPIIMARHEESKKTIITKYTPPEARDAAPQGRGQVAGLRRR